MVTKQFVSLAAPGSGRAGHGSWPCQGVYYTPDGVRPTTALIATHYEIDFSEHYLSDVIPSRGLGFFGWNTRFRGNGPYFYLDAALADIAAGVAWLREQGVEHVVICGNSGGASLMSAYLARGGDGDSFMSLCAHPGRPEVLTAWMDPAVVDERDPDKTDPSLDMFSPDNGPPYSAEFIERYRAAQVARNHRITAWVKGELERLQADGLGDRFFTVYRTWADLRFNDLAIDPSAREVGCYSGDAKRANMGAFGLACTSTLRTWLQMWSLSDSQCSGEANLAKVTSPAIVIGSDADQGCYPSDAQIIYDALASTDKQLHTVPGDHYLLTPEGSRDRVADLIADWLKERGA